MEEGNSNKVRDNTDGQRNKKTEFGKHLWYLERYIYLFFYSETGNILKRKTGYHEAMGTWERHYNSVT